MKINFSDPVVLGAIGVMVLCVIGLIVSIRAYMKMSRPSEDDVPPLDLEQEPPAELDIPTIEPETPPVAPEPVKPAPLLPKPPPPAPFVPSPVSSPPVAASASGTSVPKDVVERLETMNQRLAEMQSVLSKQAVPAGPGAPPGMGQGFSPETIDKLLRIIGNVVMQVEILQRSFNAAGEPGKAAAAPPATVPPKL